MESWGLIRDWIKAGVNSYSAWNMVLDTAGKNLDSQRPWPQNALLTVDTQTKTLRVTPVYHVFRHVSQYVDPGATRVGTTGGDALAFKNPDGTLVTSLHNSGNSAKATTRAVGNHRGSLAGAAPRPGSVSEQPSERSSATPKTAMAVVCSRITTSGARASVRTRPSTVRPPTPPR